LKNFIPTAILISITLTDHLQTTRNLIRKIRTHLPYLPIFLGGIAINHPNKKSNYDTAYTYVIKDVLLADAIKLIRSTILQTQKI
jgi:hypothetical protein